MIEAYMNATLDVLRPAGQMFLQRMDDQLRWFAEDLHDFIYELDRHPRRDWRERFDAFLADQTARGREITPESRRELIIYLEMWERNVYGGPPEPKPALQTVVTRVEEPTSVSRTARRIPQIVPPRKSTVRKLRRSDMYRPPAEREFYQKLAEARRLLAEMARAVGLFAQKLDAAGDGESIEVDADLDAIETLIWRHNDVLESARDLWLREDLEGDTYNQLAIMSDPTSVGLPRFIDDDQPRRAKAQRERISARLDQRIAFLDDVIFAMEKIEQAGTIAGFLLGGGILFQAAKQGGKVLLVKTVAMAASMAASAVVGKATGAALKAIGVEEETVEKVQNAVELISWLLILRRMKLLKSRGPTQTDRKASPDGKQENPTSEHPQNSETPKVKEPLPVDKQPGTGLVPAAPVELGKWGEARLRLYLGGKGFKPRSAFKTSRGKRFVDWMLDGIAHEAKAGINVKLTRNLAEQAHKDTELIASQRIRGAHWHFFQGATQELLDHLTSLGIQYTVH